MSQLPNPHQERRLRKTRKLLLAVLQEQVKSQDKQFDALRTASSVLVAASGVVLTQVVRFDLDSGHPFLTWLVVLGAVASAAAAVAGILVVMPATLHRHPKPQGLVERYFSKPVEEVEDQLITEFRESYHRSEPVTAGMAQNLKISARSLAIAVVLLLLAAVVKWSVQSAPARAPLRMGISATTVDTVGRVSAPAETLASPAGRSR
jgi:hypothetical protein